MFDVVTMATAHSGILQLYTNPKSYHPAQTQRKHPNTHSTTVHTVQEANLQLMWGS